MYYSIGTFSKLTRTTVAALRFYDKEGIFRPAYTDENTGYRYYLSSQLSELREIISLRQVGMSVEQIKDIIMHGHKEEQLKKYRYELENKIAELVMSDDVQSIDDHKKQYGRLSAQPIHSNTERCIKEWLGQYKY